MAESSNILLDSNIIIYTGVAAYEELRNWLRSKTYFVSAISQIEVLGYYDLTANDKKYFEAFFEDANLILIQNKTIWKSIELRQHKKMSLGDAIIAATALINDLPLITANIKDFQHIEDLELIALREIQDGT